MESFDNAHEIVEGIKNKLHGYGLKNNMVDIKKSIKNNNKFGTIGNAAQKLYPTKKDENNWPLGGIMSEDGETPANCFMVKDGTKDEILAVLTALVKED